MPKRIDPALRDLGGLVQENRAECPSTAKAVGAAARQEGVGAESLRRWLVQAEIDSGGRDGQTSEERAEARRLMAENRKVAWGRGDPKCDDDFRDSWGGYSPAESRMTDITAHGRWPARSGSQAGAWAL